MPHYAAFIRVCTVFYDRIVFRDRNTYFYRFSGIIVLLIMVGVFAMKVLEENHWPYFPTDFNIVVKSKFYVLN